MPCMGGGPSRQQENEECAAMRGLCSILTHHPEMVSFLDTDGLRWWEHHQEHDRMRIADEERQARTRALREAATGKLTAEERKELGL